MRNISAVDSVSLAIQRTRDFLFRPFAWGTYLKLGLVAIITEGLGSSVHGGGGGGGNKPSVHTPNLDAPFHFEPYMIAVAIAAVALAMVIAFFVVYLITRLRFAYFHCLVHNIREIRPGWDFHREQAGRFFWLNVGVGFGFLVVLVGIALPFIKGFVKLAQETHEGGPFDWGLLLSLILPLIPILILISVAGVLSDLILRDWMLPHYALEDATAGQAWAEVWHNIMAEKRQFLVYALLRVVLPFIASICVVMVLAIPGLVVVGVIAALEYGLHSAFADASGGSAVAGILLQVFFGLIAVGLTLLASICLGGPLSTGVREYALVFYGGRYRLLGDLLYPPVAAVPGPGRGPLGSVERRFSAALGKVEIGLGHIDWKVTCGWPTICQRPGASSVFIVRSRCGYLGSSPVVRFHDAMRNSYKVFFHQGQEIGLKTPVSKGTAWVDSSGLNINGPDGNMFIQAAEINDVELFRLHGTGRVLRVDYQGGRLFLSVVRLMIGQFAFINFFKTGELHKLLRGLAKLN